MSSESSDIISVFSKFLDPKSAKLNKLHSIDDILKLPIQSYKFVDKEESTIMKQLLEISNIGDASKLDKENPFGSLMKLEESDESIELTENLKKKIEELKKKYPTLEKILKKTITISALIASVDEEKEGIEVNGQKVLVAGLDEAGK
ncbi:MAG: hypothetical protein ACFFD7_15520, partial [Candidatus Thorarchaeota archaeon]